MATATANGNDEALVNVDDLKSLARHHEDQLAQLKALELQLLRKEAEVRRATEEHALRRELQTINQLSQRKQMTTVEGGAGRIRVSDDTLAQIVALENQIKLETRKTQELEREANRIDASLADAEQAALQHSQKIALIKDATGWERDYCAARGYANPNNAYREQQKVMAKLEEKQNTLKSVLDKLNAKLEGLAAELEQRSSVDEELMNAQVMLKGKQLQLEKMSDEKKTLLRLLQKKEKMLKETEGKDDHRIVKQLEGEKRVLHHELSRTHTESMNNSKSILAQEVRLRQLEMRLVAVNQFLQQVLVVNPDEDVLPEGVPNGATEVPVEIFDAIQRELAVSRHTVNQRDLQLEAQDAKVEQLEKKVNILHCAIVTRTATAAQEAQEMDKEYNVISIHLDYMRSEFEQEHSKLMVENAVLRSRLEAQEGAAQ